MRIMLLLETIMWKSLIFFLFSQTWFWLCPRKVLFQSKPCMANLLIRNRRIILKGSLNWNTINRSSPRSSGWGIYVYMIWISLFFYLSGSITFFFSNKGKKRRGMACWLKASLDTTNKKFIQSRFTWLKNLPGVNGTISGFLSKVLITVGDFIFFAEYQNQGPWG